MDADLDALAGELRERLLAAAGEPDGGEGAQERIRALVDREAGVLDAEVRAGLVERIAERAFGLGPLEPLLSDPEVEEVMVSGTAPVWVERRGRLERTEVRFVRVGDLREAIERILAPLGRRVDEAEPLCDARLLDGSRVRVRGHSVRDLREWDFGRRFGREAAVVERGSTSERVDWTAADIRASRPAGTGRAVRYFRMVKRMNEPRDQDRTARATAKPPRPVAPRRERLASDRPGGDLAARERPTRQRGRRARPVERVSRLLLTRREAATSLGMSVDTFERRVQPFIKVVPCGQLVLVPPLELERWVATHARYLVEGAA